MLKKFQLASWIIALEANITVCPYFITNRVWLWCLCSRAGHLPLPFQLLHSLAPAWVTSVSALPVGTQRAPSHLHLSLPMSPGGLVPSWWGEKNCKGSAALPCDEGWPSTVVMVQTLLDDKHPQWKAMELKAQGLALLCQGEALLAALPIILKLFSIFPNVFCRNIFLLQFKKQHIAL